MKVQNIIPLALGVLLLATVVCEQVSAASIGFNFVGVRTRPTSTIVGPGVEVGNGETAGVVPQTNWSNGTGANGSAVNLLDDSGTPTTTDLAWISQTPWGGTAHGTTGDQHLTAGWIDDSLFGNTTTGAQVTVTEIPYDTYDLYIYVTSDGFNEFRRSRHEVNGDEILSASSWQTLNSEGTYFTGAHIDGSSGVADHSYMVIHDLKDETLTINGRRINNFPGGIVRGNIAGIQIVEQPIPEPATVTLFALTAIGYSFMRRQHRGATTV